MIQGNEIIMLLIGIAVVPFLQLNRSYVDRIPSGRLLTTAYHLILTGWLLTVLEGFFWEALLNLLEHICYAAGSLLLAVWCFRLSRGAHDSGEA
ncbi:MAG: hypothetical protein JXL84_16690 [Deltaproteobacteria bacterium]|nr:hypothetical protein [Deltaproteobacteria bacterium]